MIGSASIIFCYYHITDDILSRDEHSEEPAHDQQTTRYNCNITRSNLMVALEVEEVVATGIKGGTDRIGRSSADRMYLIRKSTWKSAKEIPSHLIEAFERRMQVSDDHCEVPTVGTCCETCGKAP